MAKTLTQQIEEQEAKLAALDERIGRLMTDRADKEDRLAALYELRNKQSAAA